MRIRNRKSFITGLPEGKPPQTAGSRITKWIYFLVLALIVAYLGYVGLYRLINFSGKGYVEVEKIKLSVERGGRITVLSVKDGQHLEEGERVAVIAASKKCELDSDAKSETLRNRIELNRIEIAALEDQLKEKTEKQKKKAAELKRAITVETDWLKKQQQWQHEKQSTLYAGQYESEVLRRALEVEKRSSLNIGEPPTKPLTLFKASDLAKENERVTDEIDELKSEIARQRLVLKQQQQSLNRHQQNMLDFQNNQDALLCKNETIVSPVPGRIHNIEYHLHELVNSKSILAVITPDDPLVKIETYLSKDYLRHLEVGNIVQVTFPDGQVSSGKISRIESTASQMLDQKFEGYDHFSSRILITVVPKDKADQKMWPRYDRMEVRVRGKK